MCRENNESRIDLTLCDKYRSCKSPCYPVENYLKRENLTVYEKGDKNSITVYPRSREQHRSSLSAGDDKAGNDRLSSKESQAFSTENGNPIADHGLDPSTKQTGVFIRRFFGKWSYEDIEAAYGDHPHNIIKTYHNAVNRLLSVLIEMDGVKKMTEAERKKANGEKSKRYYERNREKIKAKRRERYTAKMKRQKV
jgi:hypothetical protein